MKIEAIAKVLKDFGKDDSLTRSVATDIYYSGSAAEVLANKGLVERLFAKWESREKAKAQKVAADSAEVCPICRIKTTAIKLDKDVPAVWCSRHFVVFPVRKS